MYHRYPLQNAAQMIDASYDLFRRAGHQAALENRLACPPLDHDDVQAALLDNGILLIPGSNSVRDYIKFNLRVLCIGGGRYAVGDKATEAGASGTRWHRGFLRHAQVIHDWIEGMGQRPVMILGHSLGAASTQILSMSWQVTGIAFAAPRTLAQVGRVPGGGSCLCFNRDDDTVCAVPPGFHHLGSVHEARTRRSVAGPDHGMWLYREALRDEQAAGRIGTHWPRRV